MLRTILGILAGVVVWIVLVTLLNFGVRAALPGYHEAEPVFAFTLPMQMARLGEGAIASLAGGLVAKLIAPQSRLAPLLVGAILLALFIPVHISLYDKLPLWYHLTFLISLIPLSVLGAMLAPRKSAA